MHRVDSLRQPCRRCQAAPSQHWPQLPLPRCLELSGQEVPGGAAFSLFTSCSSSNSHQSAVCVSVCGAAFSDSVNVLMMSGLQCIVSRLWVTVWRILPFFLEAAQKESHGHSLQPTQSALKDIVWSSCCCCVRVLDEAAETKKK